MTTSVSNTKLQPAITMDKLHIDSLTFRQVRENSPKRVFGIAGCLYGIDVNGDKCFDSESFSMSDGDMDTTIVTAAVVGGSSPEEFEAEYIAAKITINDSIATGTMSDAKLMAYFEAALGRMLELHGKVDISGVE